MRLNTRIQDSNGESVNYVIRKAKPFESMAGFYNRVMVIVHGQEIGYMQYSIHPNCLYINRMYNHTINEPSPFRNVGSLLFEYAFKKSLQLGKEGRIELNAIKASSAAYFKLGLRKKSSGSVLLSELLTEYHLTPSLAIKDKILKDSAYALLAETAAGNLNKDIAKVTFEEAIADGHFAAANYKFKSVIEQNYTLNELDCVNSNMQGPMYLPATEIERKKIKYAAFNPVGSNFFFSKENALASLKNNSLKELVRTNTLDPANAIELELKIKPEDQRFSRLISKIGLKMLRRNYISSWYIGVYFHNMDDVKALISQYGLESFEKGYAKNIGQLAKLSPGVLAIVFTDTGLSAFKEGTIKISDDGYAILDKFNLPLDPQRIRELLKVDSSFLRGPGSSPGPACRADLS